MIRPTRKTSGVATLAIILAVVAILIKSLTAVFAAGSLAIFLFWRAWRFECDLASIVASLTVTRTVDRPLLRQGATATVQVGADLVTPPGIEVLIRDIPPAVAIGDAPAFRPHETATYTLRLMAPGKTAFGGVTLDLHDALFVATLSCRQHQTPGLTVFPAGVHVVDGRGEGSGDGETEVNRKVALEGQSVRGYRLYRSGDDPGQIDWKVSARHNKLHIRQMTGLEGGVPLIIVDLTPGNVDPETSTRFSMVVSSAVERALNSRSGCSLLVIAGGEVVRFIPMTLDRREAFQALGRLTPVEPGILLYRAPGPSILATRARIPAGSGGPETVYRVQLGDLLSSFTRGNRSPFASAVAAALAQVEVTGAHIYTPHTGGDVSHLIQVIHQAKTRGMRVTVHAPAGAPLLPGADTMEAL